MTNASMKNLLFGISVVAIAAALSLGAFASTVQAQEFEYASDMGGWGDFEAYNDFEPYYNDFEAYNNDFEPYYNDFESYNNDFEPYYNDFESYNNDFEPYDNDFQPYDNDFQPYDNDFQPYDNDFQPYDNDFQPYDNDFQAYDMYQDSEGYYYSQGGSQAQYYSTPMTITPPSYRPTTPSYPSYPTPQIPRPTPTYPSYPSTTNNNCVNNSCNNTNINTNTNINNSINGSFNSVATVYPAVQQPIIQYTYPIYQQPVQQQGLYCLISANQTNVTSGQTVYLAWSSSYNTSSAVLSEFGNVNPTGTRAVTAFSTRTYVLTVYGPGGSNSCSVTVNVNNPAPYVSLSQIPYTGLDLGVLGNAIYWMSLLSFAVAGAYLMVYYKGGAFALAGATIGSLRNSKQTYVSASEAPEVNEEPVVTPEPVEVEESPVASLSHLPVMSNRQTKDSLIVSHGGHGSMPRISISRA